MPAGCQIRQQQGMVHDEQVGGLRPRPCGKIEIVPVPTPFRRTGRAVRAKLLPDGPFGGVAQKDLRHVARGGPRQPDEHLGQHRQLLRRQAPVGAPVGEPAQAKIVLPAFEQGGAGRCLACHSKQQLKLRNIFVNQLILQRDGIRSDHNALVVGKGPKRSGQQVGKALAGPGAGLDQEMVTRVQALRDQASHVDLARPRLKIRLKDLGQGTGWRKVAIQFIQVDCRPGFAVYANGGRQRETNFTGRSHWARRCFRHALHLCTDVGKEWTRSPLCLRRAFSDDLQGCRRQSQCLALQAEQQLRRRGSVVEGAVGIHQGNRKKAAQFTQAVAGAPRQQDASQLKGIVRRALKIDPGAAQKAEIEPCIMSHYGCHVAADKSQQFGQNCLQHGRIGNVSIPNSGDLGDAQGDGALGIHQR